MKNRNKLGAWVIAALAMSSIGFAQEDETNVEGLRLLSNRLRIKAMAEKQEAVRLAPLYGLPVKGFTPDGAYYEIMSIKYGRPMYFTVDNVNAAISTGADKLHPGGSSGLNLNGAGITLGIWDGGTVRTTHQEYTGRASVADAEGISGNHATHVGGTMIAAGVDPNAKGMSFAGALSSYGWNSDSSEMATAAAAGLRLSNHSYGYIAGWNPNVYWYWYGDIANVEDYGFGRYDDSAADYDTVAFNAPQYLIVKAAGNDRLQGPVTQPFGHYAWNGSSWVVSNMVRDLDGGPNGYDSISYSATAKNILTVAAVNDVLSYTGPASVVMSSFSSWGPTDDGRIKPDVSGNGVGVYSSVAFDNTNAASNSSYSSFNGTSMASPNVTGSLGLVLQRWRQLNPAKDPRASTMKALAIHTAKEAGAFNGPDYAFGYGLLDAPAMCNVVAADAVNPYTIIEGTLDQGQTLTYTVYSDGTQPIKATLAWTDPAGPVQGDVEVSTARLVNDLDLRITGAGTYYPWILDPANPANAATTGDNFRDNAEKIEGNGIGWYTVTVSHKGATLQPSGKQVFSLILTGFNKTLLMKALTANPTSMIGSFTSVGWVTLNDFAPPGGYTVNLTSNSPKATVPANVTVPAGLKAKSFNIFTTAVGTTVTPTITARNLPQVKSMNLTLLPGGLSSFYLNTYIVTGGTNLTGYVVLSAPAPGGGTVVETGDDTTKITTPPNVTVLAGNTTKSFPIGTGVVASTIVKTVFAKMGGNRINRTLTINP